MANPAPLEVLELISCSLSIKDLKNVRLVCQPFYYAAERFLFSEVLLLPNAESFAKLRIISRHERLQNYVKSLVYSGNMLERYSDYEDWYSHLVRSTGEPSDDDYEYNRAMSCLEIDEEELKQCYARYCFWVESEEQVQMNDNARRWMSEAMSLLPNLTSVTLARRYEPNWPGIKVKLPSRIAHESLHNPSTWAGIKHYPDQFGDLMRATCASGVKLQRLDGSGICWRDFEDCSDSLVPNAQGVSHLSLELEGFEDEEWDRKGAMVREVLNSASGLQTFEISFKPAFDYGGRFLQMRTFLPHHVHLSTLKRLKLEAICGRQFELIDLLSRNAATLRSLELGYITFHHGLGKNDTRTGSWTVMIRFLQQHLSLAEVSLYGNLGNGLGYGENECWGVYTERWWRHSNDSNRDAELPPLEETLKYRIERYIVEGGVCPLDNPNDGTLDDRRSFWEGIQDYSWHMFTISDW